LCEIEALGGISRLTVQARMLLQGRGHNVICFPMRKVFLLLAWLAAADSASACLNNYEQNEQATAEGAALVESITKHDLKAPWSLVRDELAARVATAPTVENLNDYAVALCHTGNPAKAIELLQRIEIERLNLYPTATNLGTACELAGRNEDALHWIEEGIRRNPKSHLGSEWIHVAILKAKLEIAKEPGWLKSHDVLGLDFGSGVVPVRPAVLPEGNNGRTLSLPEIRDGLQHQLHERIQFIPKPDAMVGQLIFDFGNLVYLTNPPESARTTAFPLFRLATEYIGIDVVNHLTILGSGEEVDQTANLLDLRLGFSSIGSPRPWYRNPPLAAALSVGSVLAGLFVWAIAAVVARLVEKKRKEKTPRWVRHLAEHSRRKDLRFGRLALAMFIPIVSAAARNDRQYVEWLGIGVGLLMTSYLPALLRRRKNCPAASSGHCNEFPTQNLPLPAHGDGSPSSSS
jgi:tetratricopeptide (TPR) repeat protein